LEVFTAEEKPQNIALASAGTTARASSVYPNSEIHRLEHINDGRYGNSRSWISNERDTGWVELEFPQIMTIDRVLWGRDREQKFTDRLALDYRIEVAAGSNDWRVAASSHDRQPYVAGGKPQFSPVTLPPADAARVKPLLAEREEHEARLKELASHPMVYAGVFEPQPSPTHRLHRGDAMQQRDVIEPGALSAIPIEFKLPAAAGGPGPSLKRGTGARTPRPREPIQPEHADEASGRQHGLAPAGGTSAPLTADQQRRLALAQWIADPANPLPARVLVNRLWQYHFGEGLVSTPSDFGARSLPPSHPELLDWLAAEFMEPTVESLNRLSVASAPASTLQPFNPSTARPWSLKHIHRLIVNSATYRQSSAARAEGLKRDAGSRLLWRFPPRRLEAEPIRDTILAVSGKLDLKLGGPGWSAFEPNDNYVRVYNPRKELGPGEWRRMIYMTQVRMQQEGTFGAFDCPDGAQIAPKRSRSTTPLQALNLLNSGFILQQAGFFAERLKQEAGPDVTAQVRRAFALSFSREPEKHELAASAQLIREHGLALFCRALFNANEFIFME
ncbi:MAG TPA: DUF1553 domain-containing protein, partial [Verrucomicrobiae bacterium]